MGARTDTDGQHETFRLSWQRAWRLAFVNIRRLTDMETCELEWASTGIINGPASHLAGYNRPAGDLSGKLVDQSGIY